MKYAYEKRKIAFLLFQKEKLKSGNRNYFCFVFQLDACANDYGKYQVVMLHSENVKTWVMAPQWPVEEVQFLAGM